MRTILCIVVLVVMAATAWAEDSGITRKTLTGVDQIYVMVTVTGSEAGRSAIDQSGILTDVELSARRSGLKIASREMAAQTNGVPLLGIDIDTLKVDVMPGLFAYSVQMELSQWATLVRAPSTSQFITTWGTVSHGTVGGKNLGNLRQDVREVMGRFINAWLAANRK